MARPEVVGPASQTLHVGIGIRQPDTTGSGVTIVTELASAVFQMPAGEDLSKLGATMIEGALAFGRMSRERAIETFDEKAVREAREARRDRYG